METTSKFFTPGIIFVLTMASGIWLSSSGKPLNTIIFTIHKLIALAAVILTAIQVYQLLRAAQIQTLLIALVVFAGLSVVALFVTGAFMSLGKPFAEFLLTIHRVAPFVAAATMAVSVYILNGSLQ